MEAAGGNAYQAITRSDHGRADPYIDRERPFEQCPAHVTAQVEDPTRCARGSLQSVWCDYTWCTEDVSMGIGNRLRVGVGVVEPWADGV